MPANHRRSATVAVIVAAASLLLSAAGMVQEKRQTVSLWKNPGNIAGLDLFWANGSSERAPKGPFAFLEEDLSDTQPKIRVRDAAGVQWDVKFGQEVHAEIASNRLVWALGYMVEEYDYVPSGTVTGMTNPGRAIDHIRPDGTFTSARFRRRDETSQRAAERWTFEKNPFVGTKEMSGLSILMTLLSNWDINDTRNNAILHVGGEDRYIVADLGGTFGKMGTLARTRSKWNIEDFKREEFIGGVDHATLELDYEGRGRIDEVPLEHARWFTGLVSQLTDQQLQAALRASGANDVEVTAFSSRLREKIAELQKAVL